MATTVASIGLQLLILGTVVQLSYEIACSHTYRAVNHTKGNALPGDIAKIFKDIWARPQINKEDFSALHCYTPGVQGCTIGRCIGEDDGDLFRANGCHNPNYKCDDAFLKVCSNRRGTWNCKLCKTDNCNEQFTALAKGKPTTTTPEPVTNATSSAITAMPSTHIGISAKLVVAAIVNTVLLMMVAHRAALF